MSLTILIVPCLEDNYGFLVRDQDSGYVAAVDTPEADALIRALDETGWTLTHILNTHKHRDHIGANETLRESWGAEVIGPREVAERTHVDRVVYGGDRFMLGASEFEVIDTGGHTLGHVSYHSKANGVAFVGDALFAMGCGRLFEGTPKQMWASLSRLAAMPPETQIYCAHEYTAANARFAMSVDSSRAVSERASDVFEARRRGEATVPTTIALEANTNPFLRAPLLRRGLEPAQAFAQLRREKDLFHG